jgi:signal transduction histidine kinase
LVLMVVLVLLVGARKNAESRLLTKAEELKVMSRQLWQAAKLATVGELTASVAHDLNNPLTIVGLHVETLVRQIPDGDPKQRALEIIGGEVERMGDLVANLLQFSRRSQAQISTFDVRHETAGALELIGSHLRNRNVKVNRQFAADVPMIQADRQQFRQVVFNILTNAADAMPSGGSITVTAEPRKLGDAPGIALEFTDTGTGISREDLPKVTEPFYTTKPEGKGTGLGLAICKRITEEHNGIFEIESEPGKGTTIRVMMPISNPESATRSLMA